MVLNKKLFYLGNDVVALARKFDDTFPKTGPRGTNELGDCFMELLNLMNKIRLAIQEEGDDKEWWTINVHCSNQEMLAIKEQMTVLELSHEVTQVTGQK